MDSSTFKDRHAILNPQQWLACVELSQKEPGPAAIARMRGEKFGKSRHGRRRHAPWRAPGREMFDRNGARKDGPADDQR